MILIAVAFLPASYAFCLLAAWAWAGISHYFSPTLLLVPALIWFAVHQQKKDFS